MTETPPTYRESAQEIYAAAFAEGERAAWGEAVKMLAQIEAEVGRLVGNLMLTAEAHAHGEDGES